MNTVEVSMRKPFQGVRPALSRSSRSQRWCHRVLAGWIVILALILITAMAGAQEGWQIGAIVGLRAGTCIREGPGLSYRAHTRVPEDDWAVRVIDGPRIADGKVWWDTSRRAAGDPSGGTGWVMEDQTDTDCPLPSAPGTPIPPSPPDISNWLRQLIALWRKLPDWARWAAAVVLLLLGFRLVGRVVGWLLGLLGALLGSAIIWIVLDLTRGFWQPLWIPLGRSVFGDNVPDLAFLLALLPLASWVLATLGKLLRRI
jgi:hypothetical protein